MCGICGIVNNATENAVSTGTVRKMCEVMRHRGPDEDGFYFNANVALGMRRLKVIDLTTGTQPMFNEDKTIITVFNGEIYNFLELRKLLAKKGHQLATRSDTEVIVHLYEEFDEDFISYPNGMFAIALWDTRQQKLILARDRLGEKPLHYMITPEGIVFSSEIKSILCYEKFDRELDIEAIYHYFSLRVVPAPFSIFKNIKKLLPGYYLTYQKSKVEIKKYWDFSYEPDFEKSEEYFCEALRELLINSLKKRLISDVPLGAFLSGGIDSSVVVGLMSNLIDKPVKTFSIGFKEDRYNELEYARVVAKRFKTDHHEFIVQPSAVELLEKLIDYFDEPFGGPSAIPTFLVSQMARKYVTVVVTGDGGDEIFAGYDSYSMVMKRKKLSNLPSWLKKAIAYRVGNQLPPYTPGKRFLQSLALDERRRFVLGLNDRSSGQLFHEDFLSSLGQVDSFDIVKNSLLDDSTEYLSKFMFLDTKHYLPDNVLVKVDRMSMANSLEVRTLFLDHEVVEFASKIPAKFKLRNRISKYIIKQSMTELIPEKILKRGKWGFALPVDIWFKKDLKQMIASEVDKTKNNGLFNHQFLKLKLDEHLSGKGDNQRLLWSFLVFQIWYERYANHHAFGN